MYKAILTSVYEKEFGIFVPFHTFVNVRQPLRGYGKGQDMSAPNLGNVFPLNNGKNTLLLF